jgi:hypothetical protein
MIFSPKIWRRISWENIFGLWLEESTLEKLKGEGAILINLRSIS